MNKIFLSGQIVSMRQLKNKPLFTFKLVPFNSKVEKPISCIMRNDDNKNYKQLLNDRVTVIGQLVVKEKPYVFVELVECQRNTNFNEIEFIEAKIYDKYL